ncbi:sensor histidine kinase [Nocardioides sp.]|uniref:sensor histidine kinase n=1 Tax=Nocardioides sp. TaxID=35761 RepID=UPI0027340A59|nr:sensor domain-containing protein [Nocardioides sp.]MDP3894184.1 sensor domain-containing protein [Nocardioides sp.]
MSETGHQDVWRALTGNPLRFLLSSWPWRSWAYLASGAVVGLVVLLAYVTGIVLGVATAVVVVGLVLLTRLPLLGPLVGAVERRRLRLMRREVPSPHVFPAGASWRERARIVRRGEVQWRETGFAVLLASVLWLVDAIIACNVVLVPGVLLLSPLLVVFDDLALLFWQVETPAEAWPVALLAGPVALVLAAYLATVLAGAQAGLAGLLLGGREAELEASVDRLRRSRLDLVDVFEIERRRIERDLHDGVQQRLVALTMTLGQAELEVPEGPALALMEQAHRQAEEALADLRATVRGIHPRVLVDHGIEGAVRELADRSPVPVRVDLLVDRRLPAPVEAAAYFVVSEALTNTVRPAAARSVSVQGWLEGDQLVLVVTDDGVGGAAVGGGTGLTGLITRLDALGGRLLVTSPVGGPTTIRMECPWMTAPA